MELEVTWRRAVQVWWAYFWRNLLALAATMVVGMILGAVLGLALAAAGVSKETVPLVSGPIGALFGVAISIIPVRLILGKDFGEFRLVLLANSHPRSESRASTPT